MKIDEKDYLAHYGILRRSGRYPWGSGDNQTQSQINKSFLDYIDDLKERFGWGEKEIAESLGISTTELRDAKSIARSEQRAAKIAQAQRLKDKGLSNVEIGKKMGLNESSVRTLLAPGAADKANVLTSVSDMLREQVDEKQFIDIGTGVENYIGISDTKLRSAVRLLKEEGYEVHTVKIPQLGTNEETTLKVLCPPGTTWGEVNRAKYDVKSITNFSEDNGRTFLGIQEPLSINPDRVGIVYAEDGGREADGVIFVRPGVSDVSLGGSTYAQVRVKVGDGHYLKGMAMYKDDMPDGVDLLFNTNKSDTGNKLDALKPLKDDPDNPFGAVISRQIIDVRPNGETSVSSSMNIVNEEGDWATWSKSLSSQVLSKQKPQLAKNQLSITYNQREEELNEILALTNPVVRQKLLMEFADGADAASVHMKAAALPRQASHVILPIADMPETQVYAPNYKNGENVVLIRYPHGGKFEIPELVVNNNQPTAKKLLGQAPDAIGINSKVAEILSGADFDGDTVLVIPNKSGRITREDPLAELKGFDPQSAYPGYPGMKKMTNTQTEMGKISNLITDMTIRGASNDQIARAVRHSMVVIDAEKKGLNYKQSELDNGIKSLREKYQVNLDGSSGGASTIVSRAKSSRYVPDVKPRPVSEGGPIDKETGERIFVETGRTNRSGKPKLVRRDALELAKDARELSSGTVIENIYADHSNKLKALANKARREAVNTSFGKYSPSAAKTYSNEVASLKNKLDLAIRNRPRERQAQVIANGVISAKRRDNPQMDGDTLKKLKSQALEQARATTGAKKNQVQITPSEWEAIQSGAVSPSRLKEILDNADMDVVRELATPRAQVLMTSAKTRRAEAMANAGYTRAEIADALGVSVSTLDRATSG